MEKHATITTDATTITPNTDTRPKGPVPKPLVAASTSVRASGLQTSVCCIVCNRTEAVTVTGTPKNGIGPARLLAAAIKRKGWSKRHAGKKFGPVCPACLPGIEAEAAERYKRPPVKRSKKNRSKVKVDEARALLAAGWTFDALGAKYKVSRQAVEQKLRRAAAKEQGDGACTPYVKP